MAPKFTSLKCKSWSPRLRGWYATHSCHTRNPGGHHSYRTWYHSPYRSVLSLSYTLLRMSVATIKGEFPFSSVIFSHSILCVSCTELLKYLIIYFAHFLFFNVVFSQWLCASRGVGIMVICSPLMHVAWLSAWPMVDAQEIFDVWWDQKH